MSRSGLVVVDASAIAAIIYAEPEGPDVARRLSGRRLAAPTLIHLELASVCLKRARRQPVRRAALHAAYRLRLGLSIEAVEVEPDAVLALAADTGLTPYDAAYLWLSRHLRAGLVTLDRRLADADASLGPPV